MFSTKNLVKGKLIGEGTFAKVYAATYTGSNSSETPRNVALKKMVLEATSYLSIKQIIEMIKNEITILNMNHPNIVKRFYDWQESNVQYIVMELMERGDLSSLISVKANILSEDLLIHFALDVSRALDFLHKERWIHCDVKPENVFINQAWQAKLGDFGLAQRCDDENKDPSGSINYVAPEVAMMIVDCCNDIWSFGVSFLQIFTKEIESKYTSFDIRNGSHVPIPKRDIPDWLSQILNGALNKDYEQRWSAEKIVMLLEQSQDILEKSKNNHIRNTTSVTAHSEKRSDPIWCTLNEKAVSKLSPKDVSGCFKTFFSQKLNLNKTTDRRCGISAEQLSTSMDTNSLKCPSGQASFWSSRTNQNKGYVSSYSAENNNKLFM